VPEWLVFARARVYAPKAHPIGNRGETNVMNMAMQQDLRDVSTGFIQTDQPEKMSGLVLVVDDEPMLRRVMRRSLERFGFDVVEAADGQQALDLLQRIGEDVSVVLMDWSMPNLSGEETIAGLRRLCPDVPVLVLSGHGSLMDEMGETREQIQGFLPKPFRTVGLAAALRALPL
jgi:CheY-like chemotaxis protein